MDFFSACSSPRGGEAMIKVLEDLLLCHATDELLREHKPGPDS